MTEEGRTVLWQTAERHAPAVLKKLIGLSLPENVFLNLNFPNCGPDDVKGVSVTSQGKLSHGLWLDERKDGRGFPYYWLRFGREPAEIRDGTDMAALRADYISVTPLHMDLTAYAVKDQIVNALAKSGD